VSRADRVPADPIIGRLIVDGNLSVAITAVIDPCCRRVGTTIGKQNNTVGSLRSSNRGGRGFSISAERGYAPAAAVCAL
jgi:hypothetical protein